MIEKGRQVSIEYTLTLDDGSTADSNVGRSPLTYEHGSGQILPALERELEGLGVEDTKKVTLAPEEGYGTVDPEAFQTVPASKVPEEAREVGARLIARDQSGREHHIKVHEVQGDQVVLDLNHPLAGENLHFQVKVLGIA
jgi:FKBP-type peptidyl-prolyl cis-trans isomerase 2